VESAKPTLHGPLPTMNVSHHPERRRAILMLVLGTLYWGISFPLIKAIESLNHGLVPGAGTGFLVAETVAPRFALAFVLVLVFNWRHGKPRRAELVQGMQIGLFAAGGTLLQSDGLQYTSASTSAFLTQMSVVLIPAFLALRHRRSPRLTVWLACALVLVGAGFLGHVSWRELRLGRGECETLCASAFYAAQILSLENHRYASNRAGMVTLSMFGLEAVLFLALSVVTAPSLGALGVPWTSMPWVGLTAALALVCTYGAFSLMNIWQPKITSTEAGLIYCIEPLFASIFALFLPGLISMWAGIAYPNETITWALFIGGALVTVANVLVLTQSQDAV